MRLQVPLLLYVLFLKVLFELGFHSFLCLLWQKDDDCHASLRLHLARALRKSSTEWSLFASFLQSLEITEILHPHIGRDFESFLRHYALTLCFDFPCAALANLL